MSNEPLTEDEYQDLLAAAEAGADPSTLPGYERATDEQKANLGEAYRRYGGGGGGPSR